MTAGYLFVPGQPAPQGSLKPFKDKAGNARVRSDNSATMPWRAVVGASVRAQLRSPVILFPEGPVQLGCLFVMRRRVAEPKRATPPHTRKPDLDKLTRAVLDALTGNLYTDDAQVTGFDWLGKRTAELGELPGLHLAWRQHAGRLLPRPPVPRSGLSSTF